MAAVGAVARSVVGRVHGKVARVPWRKNKKQGVDTKSRRQKEKKRLTVSIDRARKWVPAYFLKLSNPPPSEAGPSCIEPTPTPRTRLGCSRSAGPSPRVRGQRFAPPRRPGRHSTPAAYAQRQSRAARCLRRGLGQRRRPAGNCAAPVQPACAKGGRGRGAWARERVGEKNRQEPRARE